MNFLKSLKQNKTGNENYNASRYQQLPHSANYFVYKNTPLPTNKGSRLRIMAHEKAALSIGHCIGTSIGIVATSADPTSRTSNVYSFCDRFLFISLLCEYFISDSHHARCIRPWKSGGHFPFGSVKWKMIEWNVGRD